MRAPKKRVLSVVVAGVASYTSESMNLPSPRFQLMPARGRNVFADLKRTVFADGADEHQAGLLELPQKYSQLL